MNAKVIFQPGLIFGILLGCGLWMTGCGEDSSTTPPPRPARNTYPDFQHISGYVNGVWTKEHNPYVITGETLVSDGDSLIIQPGVEIVALSTINLERNGILRFDGNSTHPTRFVHNNAYVGGGDFWWYRKVSS